MSTGTSLRPAAELGSPASAQEPTARSIAQLTEIEALAGLGSFEWDLATDQAVWSPNLCRMMGLEPGSVVMSQSAFLDGLHPEDRDRVWRTIEAAFRGEAPYEFHARWFHADGSVAWAYVHARVDFAPDGRPLRVFGIVQDVTERQRSQDALRMSEESYRAIFQNSSDGLWLHDMQTGAMLDVNRAGCDLFGYTFEEMMTAGHDALLYPGTEYTAERVAEFMGRAAAGETPRFEWMGRHRDGSAVWAEITLSRVVIGGSDRILASVRDITERRAAEDARRQAQEALVRANEELEQRIAERTAELQQRTEALQEREEHFRRLIETSHDLVQTLDAEGRIVYTGPSVERLLGYTAEEISGSGVPDFIHPEDQPRVQAEVIRALANPGQVLHAEYRVRHKDGGWRWFEALARTLSADSAEHGIVANARDVTDRRLAEEALSRARDEAERAREAAERANRAKSEFLSRMSHELRTPMNSILGFAQLLDRAALAPDQKKSVGHILKAGRHLLQLINEVLEIARIEAGRQNLSLEPVRVSTVLQEAVGLVRPLAAQWGVELDEGPWPDGDVFVQADRQRLTQVLLNLLSNAIKYNRRGGRVRLDCGPAEPGGEQRRYVLRVEDTGLGIPADKVDQLFVPFARLGAEQTQVEGTGLGLALSERLTEAMEGALRLERTGSEGSVFRIELLLAADPLQRLKEPAPPPVEAQSVAHAPAKLLYIEDNLANLSLVETILLARPYWRTIPALQGLVGVELAREHLPDLILLDLHLPDITGEEVLRRLRADARTRHIPVVVITADATRSTIERLLGAGADAYLTKPLDIDEFLGTVSRFLPSVE